MPEAVDVGSVLGGRYKVTAYVLASAEKDLVLDGVDQVLNRPVSILVASPGNASQVATSARELASGDRNENIQVLDLGITETGTYLVTNRAPAADMLDLIVQQDAPAAEAPYVEPFFTDTLGSEIFGGPRSTEPETYDDDHYGDGHYDDGHPGYDDEDGHPRKSRFSGLMGRFGRNGSDDSTGNSADDSREGSREDSREDDDTSDLPHVGARPAGERRPSTHTVPPPPSSRPAASSNYSDDDREPDGDRHRSSTAGVVTAGAVGAGAAGAGALGAGAPGAASSSQSGRAASRFPLSGSGDDGYDDPDTSDHYGEPENDDDTGGPTFTRVLVGVVLTVVLVVAVVLAATQLGSIFGGSTTADEETEQVTTAPTAEPEPTTPAPTTAEAEPTPQAADPVITGITRQVPDSPELDAGNDVNLPLIIDGNPATFWGNQVYASDTFGGLATSLALVVELEEESAISQVSIDQLNGAGGIFTVLVNDEPTPVGAQQIAQGGFTAPTVTLPIPAGADGQPTGRYVIINFTQLPRLSNIQAQFPFGLRIAEIRVS
ncbi:ABC transporter substrate-binding protein [Arthrobacter agilis]|uniref:ABC transporter substrate-binding protein n=1 Tax=Arthrobacter agilis TaxID=37921 RepID=UPI0023658C48|nr:ABC transporter substrate-binding protein [Arthrobacter agilis]WDF33365.1 ABC transporter substrate-binding protein [Arthrobacter agilis]